MEKPTTTVKIIDFHPKHVEIMDMRELEMQGAMKLNGIDETFEGMAKLSKLSLTFLHDGRILCCAGFYELWPGVGEGWLLPSIYIQKYPILFAKTIRGYIDNAMKTFNLHRFQTTAYDDDLHGRWMKWIKFEKEGTMRKYTHDKKDYCVYARVVE